MEMLRGLFDSEYLRKGLPAQPESSDGEEEVMVDNPGILESHPYGTSALDAISVDDDMASEDEKVSIYASEADAIEQTTGLGISGLGQGEPVAAIYDQDMVDLTAEDVELVDKDEDVVDPTGEGNKTVERLVEISSEKSEDTEVDNGAYISEPETAVGSTPVASEPPEKATNLHEQALKMLMSDVFRPDVVYAEAFRVMAKKRFPPLESYNYVVGLENRWLHSKERRTDHFATETLDDVTVLTKEKLLQDVFVFSTLLAYFPPMPSPALVVIRDLRRRGFTASYLSSFLLAMENAGIPPKRWADTLSNEVATHDALGNLFEEAPGLQEFWMYPGGESLMQDKTGVRTEVDQGLLAAIEAYVAPAGGDATNDPVDRMLRFKDLELGFDNVFFQQYCMLNAAGFDCALAHRTISAAYARTSSDEEMLTLLDELASDPALAKRETEKRAAVVRETIDAVLFSEQLANLGLTLWRRGFDEQFLEMLCLDLWKNVPNDEDQLLFISDVMSQLNNNEALMYWISRWLPRLSEIWPQIAEEGHQSKRRSSSVANGNELIYLADVGNSRKRRNFITYNFIEEFQQLFDLDYSLLDAWHVVACHVDNVFFHEALERAFDEEHRKLAKKAFADTSPEDFDFALQMLRNNFAQGCRQSTSGNAELPEMAIALNTCPDFDPYYIAELAQYTDVASAGISANGLFYKLLELDALDTLLKWAPRLQTHVIDDEVVAKEILARPHRLFPVPDQKSSAEVDELNNNVTDRSQRSHESQQPPASRQSSASHYSPTSLRSFAIPPSGLSQFSPVSPRSAVSPRSVSNQRSPASERSPVRQRCAGSQHASSSHSSPAVSARPPNDLPSIDAIIVGDDSSDTLDHEASDDMADGMTIAEDDVRQQRKTNILINFADEFLQMHNTYWSSLQSWYIISTIYDRYMEDPIYRGMRPVEFFCMIKKEIKNDIAKARCGDPRVSQYQIMLVHSMFLFGRAKLEGYQALYQEFSGPPRPFDRYYIARKEQRLRNDNPDLDDGQILDLLGNHLRDADCEVILNQEVPELARLLNGENFADIFPPSEDLPASPIQTHSNYVDAMNSPISSLHEWVLVDEEMTQPLSPRPQVPTARGSPDAVSPVRPYTPLPPDTIFQANRGRKTAFWSDQMPLTNSYLRYSNRLKQPRRLVTSPTKTHMPASPLWRKGKDRRCESCGGVLKKRKAGRPRKARK